MVAGGPGGKRAGAARSARSYRLEHSTPFLGRHQSGKRRLLTHRIGLLRSFGHRAKQPRQRAVEQSLPAVMVNTTVRIDLPELSQSLARHLAQRGVSCKPTRRTLMKSPAAQDGNARLLAGYAVLRRLMHEGELLHIALSSTSAMRVCQPAPVAFQRASVSGGSRIEIAVRAFPDFGRPRGFSIALAMLAPRISGNTSAAGRALEKVAFVHSGFSWIFRLVLGLRFIAFHLAWIGFSQADYVDFDRTEFRARRCFVRSWQGRS